MQEKMIPRIVVKLLIPLVILFAFYVQFHGDYSPGGGFQAGVIFSAGLILYRLIFGVRAGAAVIPHTLLRFLACFGVLLFAGTGAAAFFLGGAFLNYSVLAASAVSGQHLGILLVELGVGLTVGATMLLIFDAFAAYGRVSPNRGGRGAAAGRNRNGKRDEGRDENHNEARDA